MWRGKKVFKIFVILLNIDFIFCALNKIMFKISDILWQSVHKWCLNGV